MWLKWSVTTIDAMLQLLDIYIYIYICSKLGYIEQEQQ